MNYNAIAIVTALSLLTTSAYSQIGPGSRLGLEPSPGRIDQPGIDSAWIDASAVAPAAERADRCARRYRSYNPATSTYTRFDGSQRTCR
jgi:hypothetical protein